MTPSPSKATVAHLRRNTYLHVRQSTFPQVLENTEGTKRRYALRERTTALGWPRQQIVAIDIGPFRLARRSTDWHRLLEMCARTDTLILDEAEPTTPAT